MLPLLRIIPAVLALASAMLSAQEVPPHGLVFEQGVRDTFFDGYRPPNYTQQWDIPAAMNRNFGGVPVNPKAAKYGTPVDLGDALRQFKIDAKTQRRLQCSLRFHDVFKHLVPGGNREAQAQPALWGVPLPAAMAAQPRTFSNPSEIPAGLPRSSR